MNLKKGLGIVPQAALFVISLVGCSTVSLDARRPYKPESVEQARSYMASRTVMMEDLDYELNQKARSCYQRFFVSSCEDEVRKLGAEYRRAHLEAQGVALDLIRADDQLNKKNKLTLP